MFEYYDLKKNIVKIGLQWASTILQTESFMLYVELQKTWANKSFLFLSFFIGGGGGGRSHSPAFFMKIVHKMTVTVRIKYIKYFNKGFGVALKNNLALYLMLETL